MSVKKRKKPADLNQLAAAIVAESVDPPEDDAPEAEQARLWGAEGGKARSDGMTPEERSEAAKKAAAARWG